MGKSSLICHKIMIYREMLPCFFCQTDGALAREHIQRLRHGVADIRAATAASAAPADTAAWALATSLR